MENTEVKKEVTPVTGAEVKAEVKTEKVQAEAKPKKKKTTKSKEVKKEGYSFVPSMGTVVKLSEIK